MIAEALLLFASGLAILGGVGLILDLILAAWARGDHDDERNTR